MWLTLYSDEGDASVKKNVDKPVCSDRDYFDQLAEEKGFDPLDASNWYSFPLSELRKRKVTKLAPSLYQGMANYLSFVDQGGPLLQLRHGGFRRALQNSYPELVFSKWQDILVPPTTATTTSGLGA